MYWQPQQVLNALRLQLIRDKSARAIRSFINQSNENKEFLSILEQSAKCPSREQAEGHIREWIALKANQSEISFSEEHFWGILSGILESKPRARRQTSGNLPTPKKTRRATSPTPMQILEATSPTETLEQAPLWDAKSVINQIRLNFLQADNATGLSSWLSVKDNSQQLLELLEQAALETTQAAALEQLSRILTQSHFPEAFWNAVQPILQKASRKKSPRRRRTQNSSSTLRASTPSAEYPPGASSDSAQQHASQVRLTPPPSATTNEEIAPVYHANSTSQISMEVAEPENLYQEQSYHYSSQQLDATYTSTSGTYSQPYQESAVQMEYSVSNPVPVEMHRSQEAAMGHSVKGHQSGFDHMAPLSYNSSQDYAPQPNYQSAPPSAPLSHSDLPANAYGYGSTADLPTNKIQLPLTMDGHKTLENMPIVHPNRHTPQRPIPVPMQESAKPSSQSHVQLTPARSQPYIPPTLAPMHATPSGVMKGLAPSVYSQSSMPGLDGVSLSSQNLQALTPGPLPMLDLSPDLTVPRPDSPIPATSPSSPDLIQHSPTPPVPSSANLQAYQSAPALPAAKGPTPPPETSRRKRKSTFSNNFENAFSDADFEEGEDNILGMEPPQTPSQDDLLSSLAMESIPAPSQDGLMAVKRDIPLSSKPLIARGADD